MASILVTGSADGLGRAAAEWLMDAGHAVVLHARSAERAKQLGAFAARATSVVTGDLASHSETVRIAAQVNSLGRMDAIIHNAGIYSTPDRAPTPEGHAKIFAVNTLAPYILTALIDRPARVIYLSSQLHRGGEGSLGDLDWTQRKWNGGQAYAETKLQVAALALTLSRLWPGVLSNSVDPGWVRTRMGGSSAPVDLDTGQRTQTWLAVSDDRAALTSGGYWHDQRREQPASEVTDTDFQNGLIDQLAHLSGIALP